MKIWNLFPRFVSLMLLLMACFLALRDGMGLDWWEVREITLICGGTALLITGIYSHRIAAGAGLAMTLALEIWMCFFCREQLEQELWRCYCHVIPQVNDYYRTSFGVGEAASYGDCRYLLLFLALLFGMWMGSGLTGEKMGKWRKFSSALPLVPAFFCGLLLGNGPRIQAVACLVLGLWARLFLLEEGQTKTEQRAGLLGAGCMGILILISALLYRPAADQLLKYHQELRAFQLSLEDKGIALLEKNSFLEQLFWKMGGYQQTARLTTDPPGLGEDVVFEITVSKRPESSMYFKNFIGTYYDNGIWYGKDKQMFDELAEQQNLTPEEYGRQIQTIFYENMQKQKEPDTLQIRVLKHTGNLSPLPYYCSLPKEAEIIGDDGVRVTKSSSYQVQGYCNPDFNALYTETKNGVFLREDLYQAEPYFSSAMDLYLSLPKGQLQKLRSRFAEALQALNESRYSFDLDPVPPGQDIVENFLFEQKKGYCMHFASAATLLVRITGEIPCRYVSGYLALPEDFTENEDGTYTARISQKRAHAWTEIFEKDFGWRPLEVTPASYVEALQEDPSGNVREAVARQDTPLITEQEETPTEQQIQEELERRRQEELEAKRQEEQRQQQEEQQKQSTEQQEGQKEQESQKEAEDKTIGASLPVFWKVLIVCLAGLLLPAVLFALNLWRIGVIQKRRRQRIEGENRQEGAKELIRQSFRLLELLGMPLEEEEELKFAKRVEEALSCFKEGEFVPFVEIARQVRFGKKEVGEGQWQCLYEIYRKLETAFGTRLKWYQKVWYCWGSGILEPSFKLESTFK